MTTRNRQKELEREIASRNATSTLWLTFRSGMSSIELAAATGGRVSRPAAWHFLERAVKLGTATRTTEPGRGRGTVRYYRTDEAPEQMTGQMEPLVPLRQAFPGRRIIPVRSGGVEIKINYAGVHYEACSERRPQV